MNNKPVDHDDPWVRAYRDASAHDERQPDPSVGDAVRAHARMLAQAHAAQAPVAEQPERMTGVAANARRWKLSMLGSLAVLGLVGLLVLQFDQGSTPQEKELVRGPVVAAQADAGKSASTAALGASPVTRSARPTQPAPTAPPAPPAQSAQSVQPAQALQAEQPPQARQDGAADKATVPHAETRIAAEADAAATAPAAIERSRMAIGRAGSGVVDAENDLHQLAAAGRWRAFTQRLAEGAPIDIRDARGRTPLMQAAAAGQRQMVQHLLEAGADPALVDHTGKTARQLAIDAGRVDVVPLLPADNQAGQIGR